jgi:hypothetical protein
MRQLLFVMLMVGAAFLGGVLVNGLGIRWVQTRIIDYVGLKDGGEIASINVVQGPSESESPLHQVQEQNPSDQPAEATNAGARGLNTEVIASQDPTQGIDHKSEWQNKPQGGSTGRASRDTDGKSSNRPSSEARPSLRRNPTHTPHAAVTGTTPSLPSVISQGSPLDRIPHRNLNGSVSEADVESPQARSQPGNTDESGANAPTKVLRPQVEPALESRADAKQGVGNQAEKAPAPLDPSVGSALLASLSPPTTVGQPLADRARSDVIPLEVAPIKASAAPAGSTPSSTHSGQNRIERSREMASDWGVLRHRLQAFGVARYSIEGCPEGRVVFSCLIPLAGRQAVSQRFEAEGESEFEAAQIVLRRIALWRATRPSSTP